MSDHNTPHDVKGFMLTAFISFVVLFVFAMLMMLWHGTSYHGNDGKVHYETHVAEPGDGNGS